MVNEADWKWVEEDSIREIIIDFNNGDGLMYTIVEDDSEDDKQYFLFKNVIEILPPSRVTNSEDPLDDYHRYWTSTGGPYRLYDEPFPSLEEAKYTAMVSYYRDLADGIEAVAYDDHPASSIPYLIKFYYEKHRVWKPNDEPTFVHYKRQIQSAELKVRFVECFSPEQRADIMQCRSLRELCKKYGDDAVFGIDVRRVQKFTPEDITPEAIKTARMDLSIMLR